MPGLADTMLRTTDRPRQHSGTHKQHPHLSHLPLLPTPSTTSNPTWHTSSWRSSLPPPLSPTPPPQKTKITTMPHCYNATLREPTTYTSYIYKGEDSGPPLPLLPYPPLTPRVQPRQEALLLLHRLSQRRPPCSYRSRQPYLRQYQSLPRIEACGQNPASLPATHHKACGRNHVCPRPRLLKNHNKVYGPSRASPRLGVCQPLGSSLPTSTLSLSPPPLLPLPPLSLSLSLYLLSKLFQNREGNPISTSTPSNLHSTLIQCTLTTMSINF